jgi:RNA polymerase sigma-54 factor
MALTQRLELRQSHALVMTPQLMQAIKLLELSNLDLAAYVDRELERNPLLEPATEGEPQSSSSQEAPVSLGEHEDPQGRYRPEAGAAQPTRLDDRSSSDADAAASRSDSDDSPRYIERWGASGARRASDDYNLEAFISAETRLSDHLAEQLALAVTDPAQRLIGRYLIDLVDESGYLTGDLEGVPEKLGASMSEIEAVLRIMQEFDPPGVCARNLAECLAIQLKERDRFDPAMERMVGHLDLLAKHDVSALRKICGVGEDDIADMAGEIRQLNPKPGLAFGSVTVQPIVPDVLVRPGPHGGLIIELNSETLPKVLVNQHYHAEVSRSARNQKDKVYLADCLQTATWLVRALDQRAKTILKVATEIARQQDGFLTYGVQHLRPLNLRTIAESIGMHESTVSRVTANKYMATSRGIFELKYFFTSAIAAANGGEAHSAEAVRHRIRQLINEEASGDVLSDDTIVERLRVAGINIARRTVAKYREAMRIPSSLQRRREKQSALRAHS